ncbi:MAG: hypothetical protein ACM37W_06770 [Actinomycetota bacterium]
MMSLQRELLYLGPEIAKSSTSNAYCHWKDNIAETADLWIH